MEKLLNDPAKFVQYDGLRWSGILKSIKKSNDPLQPLFEAFTNSLEAIRLRQRTDSVFIPRVEISFVFSKALYDRPGDLQCISIEDNGIGFNDENYKRLVTFKDDTKGFNNLGSGRIQMIHSFGQVVFDSVYLEGKCMMRRKFALSKAEPFLERNTILYRVEEPVLVERCEVSTTVKMDSPLVQKDANHYAGLKCIDIKNALIRKYLLLFCSIKHSLPLISIRYLVDETEISCERINAEEIPDPTRSDVTVTVPISKISADMDHIEPVDGSMISINVLPYKIDSSILLASEIKITSKGEISETAKIKLTCIDPVDCFDNCRFLFLLRSDYFDSLDGDERGNIEILDKTEFKKRAQAQGDIEEQIVLNDIQNEVNRVACDIYKEINARRKNFYEKLEQLKDKYLLSDSALKSMSLSDSTEEIFKKAYAYDANVLAKENAIFENGVQELNELDPSSDDYQGKLSNIVNKFVESLPLQNRMTLTKYVTRRKMVIELMDMILNSKLHCQNDPSRNVDEKLLHNLIFKQHRNNPLASDLWLINEEYMYFKGTSECPLSKVELDGVRIFKSDLNEEEKRYLTSLEKDRKQMRADVLLFPSEGKCVIIEFKNPKVSLDDCLLQISKYAYFIRNFTTPAFKFLTFYGYLIGERLEKKDIRAADGDFKTAPNLDYLFRPMKYVPDDSGSNQDGTLYTEVIQFSVLKERAELRNKAFIDCLKSTTKENDANGRNACNLFDLNNDE